MRLLFIPVLATFLCLTGCGIKPDSLDPTPGTRGGAFPHTYPDPATLNPPVSQPM